MFSVSAHLRFANSIELTLSNYSVAVQKQNTHLKQ